MASLLSLTLILLTSAWLPGQPAAGDSSSQRSTFVDTSFEVSQALHRIEALEDDGQWSAAAVLLQQLASSHGRHLMEIEPDRYIAVRELVSRRIAAWPPDGLISWRNAFEVAAAAALQVARERNDIPSLVRAADEWFPSSAAAVALDLAAQLAAESGDFASARRWYALLLDSHPDRPRHQEVWKARAALFAAMAGEPAALAALAHEYPPARPGPEIAWGGRQQPLGEFLRTTHAELTRLADRGTAPSADTSIFCGSNSRRREYAFDAAPEARVWKYSITPRVGEGDEGDPLVGEPSLMDAYMRAVESGRLLSLMPVFADGLFYLHDQFTVRAVDPHDTASPAWTFKIRERVEQTPIWLHDETIPPLHTTLWADGRVYANLETIREAEEDDDAEPSAALVCLNGRTGELIWRCDLPGFASDFEEAALDGAPILHNGELFAIGRRRKGFGFEACFLLRLDPRDGRLVDTIHVGEAATGSYGYRRATLSQLSAEGDLVFVQTNLGSIAAFSCSARRLAWLVTYESIADKDEDAAFGGAERGGRPIRSWNYQPPICWNDAIVCMPLDTTDVFVIGQSDGRIRRRIAGAELLTPQSLAGIDGNLLYVLGTHVVCYDLVAARPVWERSLEVGQLFGRGALTGAGLLVPTDRALVVYSRDGGSCRTYDWPLNLAGNLLPLADQLVVTAPNVMYGLVDREDAFARLERRMEELPDDPLIALSMAELAFEADEYTRGLAAADDAVRRAGGFARLTDDTTRRQLHGILTQFAISLMNTAVQDDGETAASGHAPGASEDTQQSKAPTSGEISSASAAIKLLQMAGQCASGAEEHVAQRFHLARAYLLAGKPGDAVESWQQVLSDPTLRRQVIADPRRFESDIANVTIASSEDDDTSPAPAPEAAIAGELAAGWIDRLRRDRGDAVYAAIDAKAHDRLKIARATGDAVAVMEVAECFPNSRAAAEALSVHARLLRQSGDLEAAGRSFRLALADRRTPDRAGLIRDYADCLLAAGRPDDARLWLERGHRDSPEYLIEHGGSRLTFAAYCEAVLGRAALAAGGHAVAVMPTTTSYTRLFPDRVSVLEPMYPDAPETSWDALMTYSAGQVDCRNPANGRSRWPRTSSLPVQPLFVGMDASRYFFATASSVLALTRTSGQTAWQYGREPDDDPNADPESIPAWVHHVLVGDRLYLASDRGEIVCLELSDGSVRWSAESAAPLTAAIVADDKYVCFATWRGGEFRVRALRADDGTTLRTASPSDAWPLYSMMLTRRHQLLLVRPTAISSMDPESGETVWQISAPDHFFLSTLQLDGDTLYVTTDARRISAHDLSDGRLLWRSEPIGPRADQGMWVQRLGGSLFAAASDRLACIDTADGRILWDVPCVGCLKSQAPRVTADGIITVTAMDARRRGAGRDADPEEATERAEDGQESPRQRGQRYRIGRFDLATGRMLDTAARGSVADTGGDGRLVTDPAQSFGGVFLRDDAVILLDGSQLVGYVGKATDSP